MEENGWVRREEVNSVAGFVIDTQPDLRVSRVLPWLLLGRCFLQLLQTYLLSSSLEGVLTFAFAYDLYLFSSFSSQDVAADVALLLREGVTHVLNVATGVEIDRGESSIVEERVELLDIPEQTILESKSVDRGLKGSYNI